MIEGALLLAALLVFLLLLRGASKPGVARENLGFLAFRKTPGPTNAPALPPAEGGL